MIPGSAGILLAAGASCRMGTPKQLLRVGNKTLLGSVLCETLKSDLDKVVLVLGHEASRIERALAPDLKHHKLLVARNHNYRKGMSTSIIEGLKPVERDYENIMIILADMPQISSNLINSLLHGYLASKKTMGAVIIKNRRSHPVIFNRKWYEELHKLKGDTGGRELFLEHAEDVCLVEPARHFDDRDIDTPGDYAAFKIDKGII